MKKKYVLVGTSYRCLFMYARPLAERFSDVAEVVGLFDVNPLKAEKIKKLSGLSCEIFTDFDAMITKTSPDVSIVATIDRFHHHYIIKSLEAGLDVITEKPMIIDEEKCNAILKKEKEKEK